MGAGNQTGCLRTCHLPESYMYVPGSHITPTSYAPYNHRASTSLNSPLITSSGHEFMMLYPYPYMSITWIQLETRFVRPGNAFPVINSPMSVLTGASDA
ncbi:uncharacterized protein TNCV_548091 [Trichonephila clavipes]|nr:uncharacterized protein TNCV_548091 [Trichonephila clavipes]